MRVVTDGAFATSVFPAPHVSHSRASLDRRLKVWYDMDFIRRQFYDCPVPEHRERAFSLLAYEARSSASMKRRKQNNIRAAAKRKPGYKPPEKTTRKTRAEPDAGGGNGVRSFADLHIE